MHSREERTRLTGEINDMSAFIHMYSREERTRLTGEINDMSAFIHMYSWEERTRLTGEINDMSAFIPGAERYFRRSLHVKNCRDWLIIFSGFQEKGGCPLIRVCSVITSNTVCIVEM